MYIMLVYIHTPTTYIQNEEVIELQKIYIDCKDMFLKTMQEIFVLKKMKIYFLKVM